jgi:hypothetical protein
LLDAEISYGEIVADDSRDGRNQALLTSAALIKRLPIATYGQESWLRREYLIWIKAKLLCARK